MRITMITVVSLFVFTSLAMAEQTNLLTNGGFEQPDAANPDFPDQWTASKQKGLSYAPQHYEGNHAGMLVGDGTAHAWAQRVEAPEGKGLQFSAMVKAENVVMNEGDHAYLYLHVFYKNQPYSQTTHLIAKIEAGSYDWTRVVLLGKGQDKFEIDHLQVMVNGKFSSGRLYVDDLKLTVDDSLSPVNLLRNKVADLIGALGRVGDVDASVDAARAILDSAIALLDADPQDLDAAREKWVLGASAVSKSAWAAMYPDAVNGKPLHAQMMYHGLGESEQACDYYLDRVEAAGCNGVYLSLGTWMDVIYESDLLPHSQTRPLGYFIEEAHRRGIKVFGYVAVFYGTHNVKSLPGSIVQEHPEWLSKRGPVADMPTFVDPANPQVVSFMAKVMVELATRYGLDGVGLDYIRYPGDTSLNYDERNRAAILSRYGIDILAEDNLHSQPQKWAKIREYRRDAIADAVKAIHDAVKEASPNTAIMACIISDPKMSADSVAQAWMEWGPWIDYASPMNYDDRALDAEMLDAQRRSFQKTRSLWIPAVGGMPYNTHEVWTISDWARRVAETRKHDPDGLILYRNAEFDMGVAAFFRNGPFNGDPAFPAPLPK